MQATLSWISDLVRKRVSKHVTNKAETSKHDKTCRDVEQETWNAVTRWRKRARWELKRWDLESPLRNTYISELGPEKGEGDTQAKIRRDFADSVKVFCRAQGWWELGICEGDRKEI